MLAINSHQHSALCGRSSSKAFQISRHRGAVYLPPFGALTNNVPHRRDYVLECCVPEVKLLLPAERGGYATPTASKDSLGRFSAQLYLQPYKLLAGRADDGLTDVPPLLENRVPRQKAKSNLCKSVISWGEHKSKTYEHVAEFEVDFCKALIERKAMNTDVARFTEYLKSVWTYKTKSDISLGLPDDDTIPLSMRLDAMQTYLLNQVIEDYLDDVCQYVKIGRKMFCELCELCGDHHPQADVVADAHVNDALSLCDHEQFSFQEQKILRKSKKSAKKAKTQRTLFRDKGRINPDTSLPTVPSVKMIGRAKEDNNYACSPKSFKETDDTSSGDEVEVLETSVDPESYFACLNRTPEKTRRLIAIADNPGLVLALQGCYNGPVYCGNMREVGLIEAANIERTANDEPVIKFERNFAEVYDDFCEVTEAPPKKQKIADNPSPFASPTQKTSKPADLQRLEKLWEDAKRCEIDSDKEHNILHTEAMLGALTVLHDNLVGRNFNPDNAVEFKGAVDDVVNVARVQQVINRRTREGHRNVIKYCWSNMMLSYKDNKPGLFERYLQDMLYLVSETEFEEVRTV